MVLEECPIQTTSQITVHRQEDFLSQIRDIMTEVQFANSPSDAVVSYCDKHVQILSVDEKGLSVRLRFAGLGKSPKELEDAYFKLKKSDDFYRGKPKIGDTIVGLAIRRDGQDIIEFELLTNNAKHVKLEEPAKQMRVVLYHFLLCVMEAEYQHEPIHDPLGLLDI